MVVVEVRGKVDKIPCVVLTFVLHPIYQVAIINNEMETA